MHRNGLHGLRNRQSVVGGHSKRSKQQTKQRVTYHFPQGAGREGQRRVRGKCHLIFPVSLAGARGEGGVKLVDNIGILYSLQVRLSAGKRERGRNMGRGCLCDV